MNIKDIYLTTANGIGLSLNTLSSNVYDLYDAIEDASSSEDLEKKLKALVLKSKTISLDRVSKDKIRFKVIDGFGNIHYLILIKGE